MAPLVLMKLKKYTSAKGGGESGDLNKNTARKKMI